MPQHEKLAIIGSGPAGYTAALYAARANLTPVLFEGMQPGGQLTITTEVENYPGFTEGVMGPELMERMKGQAERFGTRFLPGEITRVDLSQRPFRLWSEADEFTAHAVIVATGASAKWLGIPSEKAYQGKGVSACATCDGFFFRGVDVAVVGGGDTALEEATFLTKYATKVYVVHRRSELRASKVMQERARKNPKIEFVWNQAVDEVLGDGKAVTGLRLKSTKDGGTRDLRVQGFFRGVDVAVVGGGDTALEEATFLTKYANKVYVVHRRSELRASKVMQERARKNPKIEFVWNQAVEEVLGNGKAVTGLRLKSTKDGGARDLPVQGFFLAIGHEPNTGVFKGQLDMNEVGYLNVKSPTTRTSQEGVFAAGDVADPNYRQAVTAAGSGCAAAIDAERWLGEQGIH